MKWIKAYIFVGVIFYSANLGAQSNSNSKEKKEVQKDSITQLKEVLVTANKEFKKEIKGQKVTYLTEENIIRNPTNFTEILRFNSPIAFRDFGNGGLSTALFRGTSATNTTVLWNGIPINSVGNGQTDFNALSVNTIDKIEIISGGASALYGSGAIGGAIILRDELDFRKHNHINVFSSYGSFNTSSNFAKVNTSLGKFAFKIGLTYNSSDNDYTFLDTRFRDEDNNLLKNENATYKNYDLNTSLGYKITNKNKIYLYSTFFNGDRLFSAGIPNPSSGRERNQDFNQRNLLKWNFSFLDFSQSFKVAYLTQEYKYFNNRLVENFNFGKSKSWFLDYNLRYNFSKKINLSYLMTYENILGYTDLISKKRRESIAFTGILNYRFLKNTLTSFNIRNELNSDFSVPLSISLALEQDIKPYFKLKTNLSKNYRVPTYNELFWPVVGNQELVPEKSSQFDIGGDIKLKGLNISAFYFYINIKDKILWLPVRFANLWRPMNIDNTLNQGVEISATLKHIILKKHYLKLSLNYTQTLAKNVDSKSRLPFVPQRLLNFNLDYDFKIFNAFLQGLYQSKVFTSNNIVDEESLEEFTLLNTGVNINVLEKDKVKITVGGKVNNVFNTLYYFTSFRPNPGRNYSISINYKF